MSKTICALVLALGTLSAQSPAAISLEQAIAEALNQNLDLKAERDGLAVAEARQITAGLKPNPILTLQGQTLDLLGTGFSAVSPAGPNQINSHIDYVYERGQKRQQRMALAAEDRRLVELQIQEATRRLTLEVQSVFVEVLQSREAVALAESNLKSLRGIAQVNEARVKSGDLAEVELERSRVAVLQYEATVQQAQLALEQARTRLARLMGRPAETALDVTGEMRRGVVASTREELLNLARQRRPDLSLVKQAQARSQADLKLQIANGKVDYLLGTEYTYQRAFGFGGSSLGFSMSMPLPVYNKNQGEIARAQREGRQLESRTVALERTIGAEVELAFRQYQAAERLLHAIETNLLGRAKTVRDVNEYSYRRGEATLIEFLDAQRAFNDAVQSHNEARASLARTLYLIDAVTAEPWGSK